MAIKDRRRFFPPPINQTTGEPSFRWRRIAFFGITGVCFLMIPALSVLPPIPDTLVYQKIVDGCFTLAGWAFLIYAGSATATDITGMIQTGSARPYAPPPGKVETTETKTVETKVTPEPAAPTPELPE